MDEEKSAEPQSMMCARGMDYLKKPQMKKKSLSDSSPPHLHLCIFSKKVSVEQLLKREEKSHNPIFGSLWCLDSEVLPGLNATASKNDGSCTHFPPNSKTEKTTKSGQGRSLRIRLITGNIV